jgi:hypothetical protein
MVATEGTGTTGIILTFAPTEDIPYMSKPTVPPAELTSLNTSRETSRLYVPVAQRRRANATRQDKVAGAITRFTESMRFVYVHAAAARPQPIPCCFLAAKRSSRTLASPAYNE